jgi:hypothetical protein
MRSFYSWCANNLQLYQEGRHNKITQCVTNEVIILGAHCKVAQFSEPLRRHDSSVSTRSRKSETQSASTAYIPPNYT